MRISSIPFLSGGGGIEVRECGRNKYLQKQIIRINQDSRVVIVYPGLIPKDVMCATRTFWTFDYYGMERISILNGGLSAWKRAGYGVDNIPVNPRRGDFAVQKLHEGILADLDQVKAGILDSGTVLLDSRMASDYIGKTKQPFIPETGHIPPVREHEANYI